jgi:hypothetical protein
VEHGESRRYSGQVPDEFNRGHGPEFSEERPNLGIAETRWKTYDVELKNGHAVPLSKESIVLESRNEDTPAKARARMGYCLDIRAQGNVLNRIVH